MNKERTVKIKNGAEAFSTDRLQGRLILKAVKQARRQAQELGLRNKAVRT